jgi:hypothetical protein
MNILLIAALIALVIAALIAFVGPIMGWDDDPQKSLTTVNMAGILIILAVVLIFSWMPMLRYSHNLDEAELNSTNYREYISEGNQLSLSDQDLIEEYNGFVESVRKNQWYLKLAASPRKYERFMSLKSIDTVTIYSGEERE